MKDQLTVEVDESENGRRIAIVFTPVVEVVEQEQPPYRSGL
jgi:hypothetical protein